MNKEECKRQHLDHVQGVITRMAGNSFQIKGFCMAMATILGALYAANFRCESMIVLALISAACALVDAFYLQLERKYRELYKRSVAKMEEDRPHKEIYDMDVRKIKMNYWRCLFSKSLWMPYGIILALLLIWLFLSCLHPCGLPTICCK
ncbi:hypothetical protein EW639_04240 [Porphyromonas gingivalis]|uniref:hypothetical protein n=1 Tax=Porphyromonas gingivalis TaxID=837 RepID=UPI001029EE86|nr:hypothetical protein [Porphyromonas gingivalis]RZQ67835.1 hypothetical protein EW639_04240 [Porphyromonas gingivalis]WIM91285.1 hypothetical protein QP877_09365 [Porphyromonas gingivalis]